MYQPTAEGREAALEVLFPSVTRILKRDDPSGEARARQKQLSKEFNERTKNIDLGSAGWILIARILLFTESDKRIVHEIAEYLQASSLEKDWLSAEINKASHLIKILIGGNESGYPDVDGPSFSKDDQEYTHRLRQIVSELRNNSGETALKDRFLAVAEIHYRNDRGRLVEHTALQKEKNAKILEYARTIDYSKYAFGAVIVLGSSPTPEEIAEGVTLSQMSKDKIERSIRLNKEKGLAPFYITSGGSVRPRLTRIVEACAMKQHMTEVYQIPSDQILIESTSEHTYSNFMNVVLIAREAGMPTGTKLAVFLVPDRYGDDDQYDYCIKRLFRKAEREIYPLLEQYFSIKDGNEERAVDIVLKDVDKPFIGKTSLWRDYTGEIREK